MLDNIRKQIHFQCLKTEMLNDKDKFICLMSTEDSDMFYLLQ